MDLFEPILDLPTVQPGEFPHRLRCMDCRAEITVGEPYASSNVGENIAELVCAGCGVVRMARTQEKG